MELSYLPDSITRYTYNPWYAYPNWEDINSLNKYTKKQHPEPRDIKKDEKNCSICRQNRKRSLSVYIKNKHRYCQASKSSSSSIKEEIEEEEETERQDNIKPD